MIYDIYYFSKTHPPSTEADYPTLRNAVNSQGNATMQNQPWPEVTQDEDWAALVKERGTGWDINIDGNNHIPTQSM